MHIISSETHTQVRQHFQAIADRGCALTASPEILSELFIGAMSQISRWWFAHRKEVSKKTLLEMLSDVIPRMIFL